MNIAIIKQGTGRYLFEVPEGIVLKQGDTVKCDTVRGITDGTVWADSLNVEEPAANLIGSLTGAKFPLKQVLGKTEYKPFEDKKAAKPEEPKPEPIKLYCIGNVSPGDRLTKGEIYETDSEGFVTYDNGEESSCEYNSVCWKYVITNISSHLVPLVKRPAEVGESFLIVAKNGLHIPPVEIGDIFVAAKKGTHFGGKYVDTSNGNRFYDQHLEYLVLDGYNPEATTEPDKQESIKLYCVKDYITPRGNVELIKGTVCTFNPAAGALGLPDGRWVESAAELRSYDDWKTENPCRADCLVPLVARPAKVGEWVYVLNKSDSTYEPCKTYKVFDTGFHSCVWFDDDCKGNIKEKDYLVLDGYKPEAATEPEPIPEKSMRELVDECCNIGMCSASGSNGRRKANCPLKIANGACGTYAEAHPEMRQTLEAYLENEKKPKEPKYYTGKVVCVNDGGYPHFWTVGKVYDVTDGAMKRNDGSSYNGKATCPQKLKPNSKAVFIEFMEG